MNNNKWLVRQDGKNNQGEAVFIVRRKAEGEGFQQYPKPYTDCGRALRRANSLNGVECATVNNTTEESTV